MERMGCLKKATLAPRSRNDPKESTAAIRHSGAQQFNNAYTSAYRTLATRPSFYLVRKIPRSLVPNLLAGWVWLQAPLRSITSIWMDLNLPFGGLRAKMERQESVWVVNALSSSR